MVQQLAKRAIQLAASVALVFAVAVIGTGEAQAKSRKTLANAAITKRVSNANVQIGGDGPVYIPPPRKVACSEKILRNGRTTLAQRVKDGATKRGLRELERNLAANCNQLPSKYVSEELNREYFQTIADIASVKFQNGDAKGCLKLVEPLTRPDSETNYVNLGFEDTEPSVAALEKIEGECLQSNGRTITKADTARRPAMFDTSAD